MRESGGSAVSRREHSSILPDVFECYRKSLEVAGV